MESIELPDGTVVRLTDERIEHILAQHADMSQFINRIPDVLKMPDVVFQDNLDPEVFAYVKRYPDLPSTGKLLLVAMVRRVGDAFVLTAYMAKERNARSRLQRSPFHQGRL